MFHNLATDYNIVAVIGCIVVLPLADYVDTRSRSDVDTRVGAVDELGTYRAIYVQAANFKDMFVRKVVLKFTAHERDKVLLSFVCHLQ